MAEAPVRPSRYSSIAIVLHWVIAALILTNLYLGIRFQGLKGLALFNLIQLHKSVGLTVLALSVLRLAWRLVHRPPPYPETMKGWEKAAAHTVHFGFYAIMIGMPLTGWIMVSASPTNIPTLLYKHIPWPHIAAVHNLPIETRKSVQGAADLAHLTLAWTTGALLVLHVGAALKHQFWTRDGVLFRMAPFLRLSRAS